MNTVISITPYQVLRNWERQAERMLALAATTNDDTHFRIAARLKELHQEMFTALQKTERARLEEELSASLELIGLRKRGQ